MVYIGIDPGVSGGIAILDDDGSVIECVNMPDTPMEIFQFLMGYKDGSVCVLEDVGAGYARSVFIINGKVRKA